MQFVLLILLLCLAVWGFSAGGLFGIIVAVIAILILAS